MEHHERFDGSGYPVGLRGEQITLGARIVGLADAFEVMTAARPYKKASSRAAALREVVRCSGTHFDPAIVRAFLAVSIPRLRRALGPASWVGQLPVVGTAPAGGLPAVTGTMARGAGTIVLGGMATAVVAVRGGARVWHHLAMPRLWLRQCSPAFLDAYLGAVDERALAAVGAYQIEGLGAQLFARIDGDHFAVLGLPLLPLLEFLREQGVLLR